MLRILPRAQHHERGEVQDDARGDGEGRSSEVHDGQQDVVEDDFGISAAMAQAFVDSPVGMALVKAFPIGTLHRGQMPVLAAWQARFAPEIRKRHRKHRRK
jgi:hypothetical protein